MPIENMENVTYSYLENLIVGCRAEGKELVLVAFDINYIKTLFIKNLKERTKSGLNKVHTLPTWHCRWVSTQTKRSLK